MTYYRFTLIDYTFSSIGDSYIIDEPEGFDGFTITLARDQDWHGVFTDFTTENLNIQGVGYDVLTTAYVEAGIEANVILKIEYSCSGTDDDNFDEVYSAQVDFGRSSYKCGNECVWKVVLQPKSCLNTLRARYDTSVDLDKTTTFDGNSMDVYPYLGMEFEIPSKTIFLESRAETNIATDDSDVTSQVIWIVPAFQNITKQDLDEFSPLYNTYFTNTGFPDPDTESFFTATTTGNYDISLRLKGTLLISTGSLVQLRLRKVDNSNNVTDIYVWYLGNSETNLSVDKTYSNTLSLTEGDRLLLFFYSTTVPFLVSYQWKQDIESYIDISQNSTLDPTPAKLYLLHETLSRITESITDNCLTVKSNYFGRTDSMPYSFQQDGCGSLEAVTNGLLIRRALMQDATTPKFTISLKSLFNGLQAIHAVGMGIEYDENGNEILTVEPIIDYYKSDIAIVLENNGSETNIIEQKYYGKINIGYNKWEAEEYNGLDEFLTSREYRTSLTKTNGQLSILSDLIASGYAIEVTRRKGPSSEDWRYDNDTFIICLKRNDTYGQLMDVEQGNISNAANIIDPPTILNFRLSPVRNLLRWAWYIFASYMKPDNKSLIFTTGTGNTVATGLNNTDCIIESNTLAENQEITLLTKADYIPPIWYNETVTLSAPLAYEEFIQIQNNKYGLIGYICNDTTAYGWLQSMEYNLKEGEASFTLIPKRNA